MRTSLSLIAVVGVVGAIASGLARRTDASVYKNMDPKRDFCVHAFHQSAVLNNMLYITGGFVVYNYNSTRYEEPNTYLRTLNLTTRFTLNDPTSAPFTFTPTPSLVPEISSGALWPNNDSTLYLVSGVTEPVDGNFPNWTAQTTNALWTYQPSTNSWVNLQAQIQDVNGKKIPTIAGASAAFVEYDTSGERMRKGFLVGGNQDPWNAIGYTGMLIYDSVGQSWENRSTPFQQRSSGAMVYVPIGEKGILVSIGGTRNNMPFPLSQIEIYNLDDGLWSSSMQQATGPGGIPLPRTAFCAVLAAAPDNSSYQVFIYGGTLNTDDTSSQPQLGDVWVLSMPSFEWFNVYSGTADSTTKDNNPGKREAHSCHVAGRYMLVYGGRSKPQADQPCDKTGIFAFDMVNLNWVTEFVPDVGAYGVPDAVAKNLNASNRFPQLGIADPTIQYMFNSTGDCQGGCVKSTKSYSSYLNDAGFQRKLVAIIVCAITAGMGIIGLVIFILVRRRNLTMMQLKPADASICVEAPDVAFAPYYTSEMPDHEEFLAWELSATPRNSIRPGSSVPLSTSQRDSVQGMTLIIPG